MTLSARTAPYIAALCLFVGIAMACPALPLQDKDAKTPAPAKNSVQPSDYSKEAFVIQKYDSIYKYRSDGTWDATTTVVVRVQSQAGIQQFGNLSVPYAAANQRAEIVYVHVRKPDGSVVATTMANVQDLPATVTLQAPMYSDLHVKQVPVTGLNPGDTLEYRLRLVEEHPEIPGQFWLAANFITQGIALEEHVEIRVPTKKYVKIVSADVQPTVHQDGEETVYEWKTSHLTNDSANDAEHALKKAAAKPSIQLTTFRSWQELGEWYRSALADHVAVTPAIKKQEEQITAGLTSDDAKQRAIYAYVATQFRYIGLSFGIGRLQPHTADTVLQNKFGDCKDKHTIFAALMQAAGYQTWPALIGIITKLDPDVPSPAQFDHMISVLPQGKNLVWLDTTEEVAPFGMLASPLRDKQALMIPAKGAPELEKTPADPPFHEADDFSMQATLDNKAVLTGHADVTARGDLELLLRAAFHATPQENWTKLGQNLSYMFGYAGDVSNVQADNPDDTSKPFHMQYDYVRKDYGGSDGKQISPPLLQIPFQLGENSKPPVDPIPLGAPGEHDCHAVVALPKGDVATLPEDKAIQTDFAEYRETSAVKDGKLAAERFYNVKISKLPASRWEDYLKFMKAVQARENLMVTLTEGNADAPAVATRYVEEARTLVDQAYAAVLARHFSMAEDKLNHAKAINSTQWGLEATYGDFYRRQGQWDRAITAYRQEMANHPNNLRAGRALAGTLIFRKQMDDAAKQLQDLLQQSPDDAQTIRMLASVRMRQNRYDEAVTLLKNIANRPDAAPATRLALGQTELKAGQKEAGIADLEKTMRAAQQPIVINDAAYRLADSDVDLPEAQQYAQKALLQIEISSSKINLAGLSNQDLAETAWLGNTWDTIGWLDFKQGQDADAERYVKASWLLEQHGAVADHLGQIYEKEGKRAQAAQMYWLALQAGKLDDSNATQKRLDAIQAGKHAGTARLNLGTPEALSKLRTIPIAGLPKKFVSAQFFVLLTSHGADDVRFLSGDEGLRDAVDLLKKADYRLIFPDAGPEKIARKGILSCSAYTTPSCEFVMLPPQTARVE